ncbi:acyltransferase family protein [Dyella nitratireducens]|uniref:Membrane protein n=1 Tax=Dyella nitratireducens TaxID=1849580 RepID=A0ABQ1GBT7_9GAMM|nr:acyltransferase [Dyella nitratireducens]GGA40670.1 membrane protein [Dyella nitratireducens]GLQ40593.1 membrane protein [Dyella nitratireducens]
MNRRHDIDTLRVLAFGLLILYHIGMLYVAPVADWGFTFKSSYLADWLTYPMLFLNRWRMELLFLISGLAVHFLRGHTSLARLAGKRSLRLLLPLVFGMLVVIPVQPYVQGMIEHAIVPGFFAFLPYYWTHAYHDYGLTWAHLWYLPYVWLYTMLLLALLPALESDAGQRLRATIQRMHGTALLLVPTLPLLLAGTLRHHYPETHALFGDWCAHALYFTMFFYGYLLGTDRGLWTELARLRRASLVTALTCFALYLFLDKFAGGLIHRPLTHATVIAAGWLIEALRYTYCWTAIAAILGWGHAYLNRPFGWLPYAREAVYPWYVLHQSLMLLVAYWLLPLRLGPLLEPTLVLFGTVSGCALLHEFVIRRTSWLRPLFGLDVKPRLLTNTSRLADESA